jgi:hypothetical protein
VSRRRLLLALAGAALVAACGKKGELKRKEEREESARPAPVPARG